MFGGQTFRKKNKSVNQDERRRENSEINREVGKDCRRRSTRNLKLTIINFFVRRNSV